MKENTGNTAALAALSFLRFSRWNHSVPDWKNIPGDNPYLHMLAEGLADAPHTVKVRSTGVVRKGALRGAVRIFRLGVNGKVRDRR